MVQFKNQTISDIKSGLDIYEPVQNRFGYKTSLKLVYIQTGFEPVYIQTSFEPA